ncbi:hypothetical protein CC80DRAFT_432983 [Byssothecium circinans]|uniref:Integral membrane protein n=1 Tax=Byssothecium circinans TaxID=147558 RepID=A0A6A5UES4_9PLEO|nr:hypothetical protein CC80DRAFT_432983 [Byssothecium circinans]
MATARHPLLFATAVAHSLLSLAHTTKGLEQFKHPTLNSLPTVLKSAVKIGWYEGSVFFAIMGILNYKWSQTGLLDLADKSIVGLLVTLLFGAGQQYFRSGDKVTALILSIVGVLQGVAAQKASV